MRFAIAILFSLVCSAAAQGAVSGANSAIGAIGYVDVVVKTTAGATPYPEEMVLLTARTVLFRTQVTEEDLEQPAMVNFSWKQLGPDRSYMTDVNGAPAVVFERILALFPVKAGKLTIGAFVHHITFVGTDNVRHEADLRSSSIQLEVRPWASARGGPDATNSWWLPARSLTVTDKWEPEPDRLKPGETARRTVTLDAAGITADHLPPAPEFNSHGVLTFGGTVERATLSTPTGPLARATYRWDVGLAYGTPATIQAIHIPWFDTTSRRMRDAVIPARRVAFTTQLHSSGITTWKFSRIGLIGSGFVSFVIALAILFAGSESGREFWSAKWRDTSMRGENSVRCEKQHAPPT